MTDISFNDWTSMSDKALAETIGTFVRHHRMEQNKTQDELANAAGISRSTLSLLERGETVTVTTLIQVLRVLDQLGVFNAFEVRETISPLALAKLQKEIDAAEEVNKGLQKKLADIQEKNRLWKLQASQLENKKRDANLDLNYQQSQSAAAAKAAGATDDLQAQLVQSLKEEKELTLALDKLSAQKDTLPKETAALKKKNVELGNRVKDLKKQIAAQETKNEKMQKAALKGVGAAGGQRVSPDLLKKKKEL